MRDFVTEDEAGCRWCPHARVITEMDDDQHFETGNREENSIGVNAFCLGAKCMAWRWSHQDAGPNDPPTGFCGLAVLPKYI